MKTLIKRNTGLVLSVLAAALGLAACDAERSSTADSGAAAIDPANATYSGIEGESVQLADGLWEGQPYAEGAAVRPRAGLAQDFELKGDLDGDGQEETVVVLWYASGGSGTFQYLAILDQADGVVSNSHTAPIGDRVKIKGGSIENGAVLLDVIQHGPGEPACCPTQEATRRYDASLNLVSTSIAGAKSGDLVDTAAETMTEAAYRRHIEILASDEFGGRMPATPGEELTIAYLLDQFQKIGLEPGNGDSWTQDVPLMRVTAVNTPDLRFSGGTGEDMVLAYGPDQVIWSRRQMSEAVLEDSEMVFVGYGIDAPERGWNDYEGIDVSGKTVVMLVNDPGFATQDPELFNGNAMTYYGRWDYKFGEASRRGAAGAIIVHDTLPAAYGWNTVENSWTGPQLDMVLDEQGAALSAVQGWIQKEHAETLFAKAGLDLAEMYEAARKPGFEAVPMNLAASASIENTTEPVQTQNVAALLRGSEAPEEVFIYMAHWDHLGTDPALEGDQIYNGAMDNASGTAALLEIAGAYAALPQAPRRSVLFLSVTAEEQGLLGSQYYASNPIFPLKDTVGGLNMDGMNNFGATRDITVIGLGMSDLDTYLQAAAAAQERVLEGDRESEKGFYYRSDHFELAKEGVPMLYPRRGYNDREKGVAYGMEKSMEYNRDHYHRVSDEYDLSWNVDGAMEDMEVFFRTGLDVANSDDWPNWKEGTEFRAKRDEQMQ